MYESEVSKRTESADTLPKAVLDGLGEYRLRVRARTVLPWGEHCTECVWPSCYTSCELYDPRIDGACRQFDGGVTRVPTPQGTVPYLQKITFRRWAKLWTVGTAECRPLETADRWERVNIVVGSAARSVPAPGVLREKVLGRLSYIRRNKLTRRTGDENRQPDYFVVEMFNPSDAAITLTLSIHTPAKTVPRAAFQRRVRALPGLTREKVPFSEIARAIDTDQAFEVELVPNDGEALTLYFGLIDFVQEIETQQTPAAGPGAEVEHRKCKCVVWDLDNTLWNGVLIEDGVDRLALRDGVKELVAELDRRGILQSVASKNNADEKLAALERFGLRDFLLYPQIHWSPKSRSVAAVAEALNIGLDTVIFVDDQEFERREVAEALAEVRVADPDDFPGMLDTPAFQLPVTEESRNRRLMYRQQEQREASLTSYQGDYIGFLRDNQMRVSLSRLTDANMKRVYELAQRTNQMNFSGNRYSTDELERIAADPDLDTYVIRCSDRFGAYGIVGFSVVDHNEPRLLDLMFSCRVQAKRVEHGFLAWLLREHRGNGAGDFYADYRKTPKNEPSGAVFQDVGFEETAVEEGVSKLRFKRDRVVPEESVVQIIVEGKA
jgi:FkbH-like protein